MAAAISASALIPSFASISMQKRLTTVHSSLVLGLPAMPRKGRVTCLMENKSEIKETKNNSWKAGMGASLAAAIAYAVSAITGPAMALVDDRMSTEGTGLPFGLSNNLLGWILFGIFGLIWSFYIVYTSSLDEDDDSGLSL